LCGVRLADRDRWIPDGIYLHPAYLRV
jgi:hypothetical protein